ncbi:MAG: ankyrin repeat domain-containing protein [Planctomycetota bacterium]|nr:ankyrin repeat domain-containing protein [Planctomycetota bacterium]
MKIWQAVGGVVLACVAVGVLAAAHQRSVVSEDDFCDAVTHNNVSEVRRLLEEHPSLANARCPDGWGNERALEVAAYRDYTELAKVLLSAGAGREAGIDRALWLAVEKGHGAMAALLVKSGADVGVTHPHYEGQTLLEMAARAGDLDTVKLLLATGAKIPPGGGSLLYEAKSAEMAEFLIAQGVPVNGGAGKGRPAMHNRNVEVIRALIAHGGDVNAADDYGKTAMHGADAETVKLLVAHGGNANARDKNGWTPLHHATRYSADPELVRTLLAAGADANARNQDGQTPLKLAVDDCGVETVNVLLRAGVAVNAADNFGRTPLHEAAGRFHGDGPQIVRALLDAGADVTARAKDGMTPMDVAERIKDIRFEVYQEVKSILKQALNQRAGGKP